MYEINVSVLEFLRLSIGKAPVTFRILKRYLRRLNDKQLKNTVMELSQRGYISKSGRRRHYIYSITSRGLSYLEYREKEALKFNLRNELAKYIRMLDGDCDI